MSKLVWDQIGKRLYETGTRQAALFLANERGTYKTGVAWSGMQAVKHAPDGAEPTKIFADDIHYVTMLSQENFKGSIEAFTYPREWGACDGSVNFEKTTEDGIIQKMAPGMSIGQQARKQFGLAYLTRQGNDTQGITYANKLHLIYGAKVSPSAKDYQTVNESPEATVFTWSFDTTPVDPDIAEFPELLPTAYVCIDQLDCTPAKWQALLDEVYGKEAVGEEAGKESRLPSIKEVFALLKA